MKSILTLFQTIFGYTAILTGIVPLIVSIFARRKGVKFDNDIQLFEFYIYFSVIGQFVLLTWVFTIYDHFEWIIYALVLVEVPTFAFLLLKWMNLRVSFLRILIFTIPFILIDALFVESLYQDFLLWCEIILMLILSLVLTYKIDKGKVRLLKEHSYIHIGIFLYSLVTIIGMTPSNNEIRTFGVFLHHTASVLANYYFYRSFRCLYP